MVGVGEAFRAQARVQKGTGKALGTEIAEGGFWQTIQRLLQTRDVFLISWEQWASEQYVFCFMRAVSERAVRFVFHESREWASSMFFISWEQWAGEQYVLYFMRAGSERAVRFVLHWEESGASGFFFRSYGAVSERADFFLFLLSRERASGTFCITWEQRAERAGGVNLHHWTQLT